MATPDNGLPTATRHNNHKTLSSTQTVVVDESNATFQARNKAEACVAEAIIDNSPSGALLTHTKGEFSATFKDPKNSERVQINGRDDGSSVYIEAQVDKLTREDPKNFQWDRQILTMRSGSTGQYGDPKNESGVEGNAASVDRATKAAAQVHGCLNSSQEPSRTFKKPFFTP